jgi:ABC-2 type transport system ATP-binding protein
VEPTLTMHGLHKAYGRRTAPVHALRDWTLEAQAGKVLVVLGVNGAGKTTAFHSTLGLITPDRGTIRVLGREPKDPAARSRLGYVPEVFEPRRGVTGQSFLEVHAGLAGVPRSELRSLLVRLGEVLDFDYAPLLARPLARMSKGQRQRFLIAQASLGRPAVMILDEPTSGLDPLVRAAIRAWIAALATSGTTVLMSTHLLEDAAALGDEIAFVARGRVCEQTSAPAPAERAAPAYLAEVERRYTVWAKQGERA